MYVCRSVPPTICLRTPSSHKTGRVVSRYAPKAMCLVLKNVIKRAYFLQQPACWHITSKAVVAFFGWWGKPERPREKSPQACTEHVKKPWTLHKHKRRDIGLPDRMEVPNRQAAQRGWINWNYSVGYTVSLLVTLIYDGLPKPRLFKKGQEFPSPTFSEAPGTSNRN